MRLLEISVHVTTVVFYTTMASRAARESVLSFGCVGKALTPQDLNTQPDGHKEYDSDDREEMLPNHLEPTFWKRNLILVILVIFAGIN
jgi:hypothetical protein